MTKMTEIPKASEVMADPHLRNTSPLPSDGMVLGITTEVVNTEIVTLVRMKLSNILKISLDSIHCGILWHDGKVIPEINIETDSAEGLSSDDIRQVIQSIWWGIKPELEERLRGLRTRRAREKA